MHSVSNDVYILKIGSNGEIVLPDVIMERLGLEKGQSLLLRVENEEFFLRKLRSAEDILSEPSKVTIDRHALIRIRKDLSDDLER